MLSRLALYLVSAGFVVFLLSVVVMAIAGISLRGHRFAYGEALADSLLLNIRVTAYPPGGSAVDVRAFEAEGEGMQHSALYDSPALARAGRLVPDSPSEHLGAALDGRLGAAAGRGRRSTNLTAIAQGRRFCRAELRAPVGDSRNPAHFGLSATETPRCGGHGSC
jgi:hypothetical protein